MALRKREIINVIFEGKGQGTFVKARGDQITALVPWSPRAEKHIEHFTKFGSRRKQHSMSKQMWDLVGPRQTKFHTKDLEILTGETVDFWRGKNLHGAETRTRREQSEDKRAAQDDETLEGDHDGAAISRPDPLEKSVNPFGSKKESNKFAQDVEGEWTCTSCYQPDWTYFSRYQLSKDSNEGRQKVIRQARGSMAVHDFLELVVPEEMLEQLEKIDDSVWDVVEDARGFIDPTLPFWAGDSNWTPIVVA
ncbi:hypothetical protein HII31_12351 [Pseudocercospora fuligena]|uniref:Uncharacterized protein n=1 Tax=Pseudocercospora fuligena TaxID=685502 RepID=A0A8H6RA42_9PEZI|nr:hypothetical protein HII31_12351 [Pseudocercospora fuligena]